VQALYTGKTVLRSKVMGFEMKMSGIVDSENEIPELGQGRYF
jgi:hypothetical protein